MGLTLWAKCLALQATNTQSLGANRLEIYSHPLCFSCFTYYLFTNPFIFRTDGCCVECIETLFTGALLGRWEAHLTMTGVGKGHLAAAEEASNRTSRAWRLVSVAFSVFFLFVPL